MPKIIPDLSNRILTAASKHFETLGYERTEMKKIASDLGISVGTLYNYFPSKPDLFLAVGLQWRAQTTKEINRILDSEGDARTKVVVVMETMLTNAENFTGLWKEFMATTPKEVVEKGSWGQHQGFDIEEKRFLKRVQELLKEVWAGQESAQKLLADEENRLVQMLFMSLFHIVMRYPGQKDKNMEFLKNWTSFLFP